MRRNKTTTYGQKGGEGPNRGRRAVTFEAISPDGKVLRRRFFTGPALAVEHDGVAALLAPGNGHDWSIWQVAASQAEMPSYVKVSSASVVFVTGKRVR